MVATQKLTPAQVTDQFMRQFWQYGVAQTTVDDLVTVGQLSRSQFYRRYHSKSVALRQSLQAYQQVLDQQLTQLIQRDRDMGTPLPALLADCLLMPFQSERWPAGCLMVNLMAEMGHRDALVADQTQAIYMALQTRFVGLLSDYANDLPDSVANVAASLMQVRTGLQILAKQQPSAPQLKQQALASVMLIVREA
ncbi:TetR/AcrR family transcriptional regulator [Lactiplantibacillus daowaiensis]|uniref:TetR/AcrR family transcriptional regulator n=1 Tax=Lactiplantibacillus daowaiensis TaxID=2559918 RepID=A0ABW1S231_9LACO|nr:TetR/AcrR family transcriptional regulator [Lactiplantibacillus daowaiensis]